MFPTQIELIARHNHFIEQLIKKADIPSETLRKAIHYSLFPGGKRIRPLLVYLSGQVLDVSPEICDYIAAAVEFTHAYSLIHDDLPAMDNDDYRRGKPTCHRAFDEATAILAGDALQAIAIEILSEDLATILSAHQTIKVIKTLVKASGPSGMVSGQALDLSELAQKDVSIETLSHIHELKTGRLLSACILMPLQASEASIHSQHILSHFAKHLGLVFQIHDDYLDRFGAHALGKGRSSDTANNKFTFADKYNQSTLWALIQDHYQTAIDTLSHFEQTAKPMQELLMQLKNRR